MEQKSIQTLGLSSSKSRSAPLPAFLQISKYCNRRLIKLSLTVLYFTFYDSSVQLTCCHHFYKIHLYLATF